MARWVALVGAVIALGAGVALADSPPITVTVHPTVTPNKAGTPAHPQGVHLDVRINIGIPEDYTPPLVQTVDVWFPNGGLFNPSHFPTCSVRVMDAFGPGKCPRTSIMGHGRGVARADQTFTYPTITIVNGGPHVVYFYTVLNNPARVQEPVPGQVTRLSGKWSYHLRVRIPKNLQIVAGVPIVLQSLHISAGRGDWLATTYCPPNHLWAYHALTSFDNRQTIVTDGTVGCRS
jgi:hypothetical protein